MMTPSRCYLDTFGLLKGTACGKPLLATDWEDTCTVDATQVTCPTCLEKLAARVEERMRPGGGPVIHLARAGYYHRGDFYNPPPNVMVDRLAGLRGDQVLTVWEAWCGTGATNKLRLTTNPGDVTCMKCRLRLGRSSKYDPPEYPDGMVLPYSAAVRDY